MSLATPPVGGAPTAPAKRSRVTFPVVLLGIAGVLMNQILPFADPIVLALLADFEQAVYALVPRR